MRRLPRVRGMHAWFPHGLLLTAAWGVACSTAAPPEAERVSAATAALADADLQAYHLRSLETRIQTMPDGFDRNYFGGMLAARSGRFDQAITELTRVLPHLGESAPRRAAAALEAIATAHRANDEYGPAALAYDDLEEHFADQLEHFPADDAALARILRGSPAQTIAWRGPVDLKTVNNPIGSRDAELVVNGVRARWLLDTGANQSVVTRTFLKRLGITPLPGVAPVGSGVTGRQSTVQVALLPTLQVGGAALTNVVLLVLDDANLRIGQGAHAYQIDAILGYPVLKALGVVTFTRDRFLAGSAADASDGGARMYMRGLTPALECEVAGQPLLFTFDTGASSTNFSVRYYERFRAEAATWQAQTAENGGAGGSTTSTVSTQPQVRLHLGPRTVALTDVPIFQTRMNAGIDILFGNLGMDFVSGVDRFTLNFSTMTFSLGKER